MRYLIAIVFPPLAVLLCGKPVQAILNLVLTLFLWVPGIVHALFVVADHKAEKRTRRIERALDAAGARGLRVVRV
jgi:uncharacterized membrane protein YqaE (UPF0057 family)